MVCFGRRQRRNRLGQGYHRPMSQSSTRGCVQLKWPQTTMFQISADAHTVIITAVCRCACGFLQGPVVRCMQRARTELVGRLWIRRQSRSSTYHSWRCDPRLLLSTWQSVPGPDTKPKLLPMARPVPCMVCAWVYDKSAI